MKEGREAEARWVFKVVIRWAEREEEGSEEVRRSQSMSSDMLGSERWVDGQMCWLAERGESSALLMLRK